MTAKAYREILDRHHRQIAKDVQAMLTEADDYRRTVEREHPEQTDLISYLLTVNNEIRELKAQVESFRRTWIN